MPDSWKGHTSLPLSATHDFNLFATVKEKVSDLWRSSRNVYIYLINGFGPIKQQVRWSNEIDMNYILQ